MDDEVVSDADDKPVIWETSFTEPPRNATPRQSIDNGPAVSILLILGYLYQKGWKSFDAAVYFVSYIYIMIVALK